MLLSEIMKSADLVCDVRLENVERVEKFNKICCETDGTFDVISGRYVVDGKSILGLFSLSLNKPVTLAARFANNDEAKLFEEKVKEFVA